MSRGSSRYSGHLQQMFPGLARDWTEWLRRKIADDCDIGSLPGGALPGFTSGRKELKKWPDLDAVAAELRTRSGLTNPPELTANHSFLGERVIDPSNVCRLDRLEGYLAWAHMFKAVSRLEVVHSGNQRRYDTAPPLRSLYAMKDAADQADPLPAALASSPVLLEHLRLAQVPGIASKVKIINKLVSYRGGGLQVVFDSIGSEGRVTASNWKLLKRSLVGSLRAVALARELLALGKDFKVEAVEPCDLVEALKQEAPLLLATDMEGLYGKAVPHFERRFYEATLKLALQ